MTSSAEAARTYAGFQVQRASDLSNQGLCMILYGPAGSGKTTLAASIADSDHTSPAVMIEAEGGGRAVSHRTNLDVISIHNWKEARKFTQQVKKDGNFPWKGIVLDNLSEYADLVKREVSGATDAPTQPEWGRITNELKDFVRTYRDFARDRGITVVICAWDEVVRPEVGRAVTNLAFTPAFRRELPGIVDTIGHIDVTNNPNVRVLNFEPSPYSQSKFRRSADDAMLKVPYKIPYTVDKLPLPDIIDVMHGTKEWPSEKYNLNIKNKSE